MSFCSRAFNREIKGEYSIEHVPPERRPTNLNFGISYILTYVVDEVGNRL